MNKSSNFAVQQVADIAKLIDSGTTTSVLGVPGAGITLFLKHLSAQPLGHMIYLDVFSLPSLSSYEFHKSLLEKLGGKTQAKQTNEELVAASKRQLEKLVQQNNKVVICIAGFDQLQPEFSAKFFHYLRTLRNIDSSKVVFIFGVCRRLETILPADLINTDLSLFSSVYYLKPYNEDDLRYLLSVYGPRTDLSDEEIDRLITLSGGHFQFLQLLLNSERRNDPTQDPFIQLAFKNIFTPLSTPQKAIVRKLAATGTYNEAEDYLKNVGIIKKIGDTYELFSPLFADCVRTFSAPKLPVKERRLLSILKKNEGRVVSKRDIFDAVWRGQDIGSEWALNALVYRLRKHPAFIIQNYTIESHKKLGYTLQRNF
jgi:hypothetical protein